MVTFSSTTPAKGSHDVEVALPPERAVLSIVVPAYNEEHRIGYSMRRIGEYLAGLPYPCEVIVVDDGSAEAGKRALATAASALPPSIANRTLRHDTNRGKGAAVRTGCLAAEGEYIAFLDADLATPPEYLSKLIEALDSGADVAIGVRNQLNGTDMRHQRSLSRRLAGAGFATAMSLLLPGVRDSQCPLKAFRREAARQIFQLQRVNTWAFDAELLLLARKLGMRLEQVPVAWRDVDGSKLGLDLRTMTEPLNLIRMWWTHRSLSLEAHPRPITGLFGNPSLSRKDARD